MRTSNGMETQLKKERKGLQMSASWQLCTEKQGTTESSRMGINFRESKVTEKGKLIIYYSKTQEEHLDSNNKANADYWPNENYLTATLVGGEAKGSCA